MKLMGQLIQRTFLIEHNGKLYYVDYSDADYPASVLLNRNPWEIFDESHTELNVYFMGEDDKETKKEIEENIKLSRKLIDFCKKKSAKIESHKVDELKD